MQAYEDARAIAIAAGSSAPPTTYTGGTSDLAALKTWLVSQLASFYGVPTSTFNTADMYSTSLVRDFVHRALKQVPTGTPEAGGGVFLTDVGMGFRSRVTGNCGTVNGALTNCWRALGFQARYIDSANGPVDDYDGSHVQTEVWIPSLGQYVVQDAYFNMTPFSAGLPLSWLQQRSANGSALYDHFNIYLYFISTAAIAANWSIGDLGILAGTMPVHGAVWKVPFNVRQCDTAGVMSVTWDASRLFPDWQYARNPTSSQGGTFADVPAARNFVRGLKALGLDWLQIAYWLRVLGKYVTGFRTAGTSWITVRLAAGGYETFWLENDSAYAGAIDELWSSGTLLTDVQVVDYTGHVWTGLVPALAAQSLRGKSDLDDAMTEVASAVSAAA